MTALILFSVGGVFSAQRQIQMLQQNSYYPSRYFKWLKGSKTFITYISVIFLIVALSVKPNSLPIVILAAVEVIVRFLKQQKDRKKSIKKLVYTQRVIRLTVTIVLIFAVFTVLSLLKVLPEWAMYLSAGVVITFSHFPQLPLFSALYINKPIEIFISNRFINDAKKILKSNKNLTVIGVTGSFGKTSVKFILNRILSEKYNTLATPESFNTPMGIVRTVRSSLTPATEIFIAEMGAKNIGDIKELCDIVNPTYGIITAVGPQHLETFKSVKNVADTKFELADACLLKENGKIYVNFDSKDAKEKAQNINNKNIVFYGTAGGAVTAKDITMTESGTEFNLCYKEHNLKLVTKLLGKHSVTNILGAAGLALDLGVDEAKIKFAVASLKPAPHRLELKSFINGSLLIDDAYNSNPVGCLEAVDVLASFKDKKKIIVTPGLVELGDKEYECNYKLGSAAAEKCDVIILVGQKRSIPMKDAVNDSDFNKQNLYIADSFADAMKILHNITDKNSIVLFENDLPDNYAE